jgi:hypothetical protein
MNVPRKPALTGNERLGLNARLGAFLTGKRHRDPSVGAGQRTPSFRAWPYLR